MFAALLLAVQIPAPLQVTSANGRFVAEITPQAGDVTPARADLVVHELGADGVRRKRWSGLLPVEAARGTRREFVTDDGAAFVRIDDRPGEGIAVREVLKGSNVAAIGLDQLVALSEGDEPWIDLEHGLRWRPSNGLNAQWMLDLLGQDGVVRTLDLDGGGLEVKLDHTRTLDLLVHPPVPEPVRPATRETYVDSWEAPILAWSAATIEIEGRGHDPSAGWRFIGFLVQGNPFETGRLVLVPHSVPPQSAAAQVLRPHLWTARVNGLPPGRFQLEVCGRETAPADPRRDPARLDPKARTLELLSPHTVAELEFPSTDDAARNRVAFYDDGRIELDYAGKRVYRLALRDVEARIRAAVAALHGERPRPPARADVDRLGALTWRVAGAPARVLLGANLAAAERVLESELRRLHTELDPARAPRAYALSAASSTLLARIGWEGAPTESGAEFTPERFQGRLLLDPGDVLRSQLSFSIDAASLRLRGAVEPAEHADLESAFRERTLEAARHPRIEFSTTGLAFAGAGAKPRALAELEGESVELLITGDLALHGVKRTLRIPFVLEFGADRVRARGRALVRHTEHGMQRVSSPIGARKAADELVFELDLVLER